jgi:hypothetical protein
MPNLTHIGDIVDTVPPKPGEQLTKAQAGYVDHGPFTCGNCSWFKPLPPPPPSPYSFYDPTTIPTPTPKAMGDCNVVGYPVARGGCCDYWAGPTGQHEVPNTPQNVGMDKCEYVEVEGADYTCAQCIFFDAIRNTCWPVKGPIAPEASCNKWMPNYSAITPSQTMPLDDYASIRQAVQQGTRSATTPAPMPMPPKD